MAQYRASRTKPIEGIESQPHTFYMGVVNGGVWKTTDAGRTWVPVFDSQPTRSIGAMASRKADRAETFVRMPVSLAR